MDGHIDGSEVWCSISKLARLKGVSKQAISKRVKRLVKNGVLETRAGEGVKVLVSQLGYDHAIGEAIDRARWASLSEIARIEGKSRQAVSKRVKRLVESHVLQTMSGEGGEVLVDREAYESVVKFDENGRHLRARSRTRRPVSRTRSAAVGSAGLCPIASIACLSVREK